METTQLETNQIDDLITLSACSLYDGCPSIASFSDNETLFAAKTPLDDDEEDEDDEEEDLEDDDDADDEDDEDEDDFEDDEDEDEDDDDFEDDEDEEEPGDDDPKPLRIRTR